MATPAQEADELALLHMFRLALCLQTVQRTMGVGTTRAQKPNLERVKRLPIRRADGMQRHQSDATAAPDNAFESCVRSHACLRRVNQPIVSPGVRVKADRKQPRRLPLGAAAPLSDMADRGGTAGRSVDAEKGRARVSQRRGGSLQQSRCSLGRGRPGVLLLGGVACPAWCPATASSPEERRRRREEHEYGRRQEEVRGLRRARLDYDRHASMDLSVPKRAASPCSAPQRPLLVPAMVRHVPGSPPAFPSSDSAASPVDPEIHCNSCRVVVLR
ncbi:hypothetical protein HPB47_006107 [Ixodes persulcatus]|uniref:Uncharacterized protein n=1 Tax=Ixodes persulcatus TaxID=34615 RepID=A0AC60PB27_IXOPE|nr:hypothetical protein HPB47_006107 [Ixodes persulcatus]